jgi:serine protease
MLSVNPSLTPAQVKSLLSSSARSFPTSSSDPAVLQCHTPDGLPQDECLCTSSTCGAGLLNAAAAVSAALAAGASAPPTARVSASSSNVSLGGTVDLDGRASTAAIGHTITSYLWQVTGGNNIAVLTGGTSGPTTTVATSGVGTVTVQLTVTDSAGSQDSRSASMNVTAAPVTTGGTGSGSSGGGGMQGGWLAALALAVLALAWCRRLAVLPPRP